MSKLIKIERKNDEKQFNLKHYIEFDKDKNKLFDSVYFDNFQITLKNPLIREQDFYDCIEIDEFCIENKTFLAGY